MMERLKSRREANKQALLAKGIGRSKADDQETLEQEDDEILVGQRNDSKRPPYPKKEALMDAYGKLAESQDRDQDQQSTQVKDETLDQATSEPKVLQKSIIKPEPPQGLPDLDHPKMQTIIDQGLDLPIPDSHKLELHEIQDKIQSLPSPPSPPSKTQDQPVVQKPMRSEIVLQKIKEQEEKLKQYNEPVIVSKTKVENKEKDKET